MASNKKKKLNDKVGKIKDVKYVSDEVREARRFVIILLFIIVVVLAVYGVSKILVKEENDNSEDVVTPGVIDYNLVSVGTMLNRDYKEYYVMVYDFEDAKAVYYSTLASIYANKEKAKQLYYCDLSNHFNKDYVGKKSNPNAKKIEDLAFGEITLVKVKNGEIVKYIEDIDTIKKELGI